MTGQGGAHTLVRRAVGAVIDRIIPAPIPTGRHLTAPAPATITGPNNPMTVIPAAVDPDSHCGFTAYLRACQDRT